AVVELHASCAGHFQLHGGCAVAGPEAATATRTHARTVEPGPLTIRPPHHLWRSERDRHMTLEGDRVERDIAGHLIGADRHASVGQDDSPRRQKMCPGPPHPLRGDPPSIERAPRDATGKLHSPGLADIRGPGSMQLQLAGAAAIEPAGD